MCGRPLERDPDRFFRAGMEAMASGDLTEAVDLLDDCTRLNPDHLSGRYNLGMALCLASRCDEAIEQYETIAREQPEYAGIYTALGQAAFGSFLDHQERAESQREAMVRYLLTAIEQDPYDVDAHFSLGNVYIAINSPEKSLRCLQNALHLHPDSPAIHYTIAKALKMLGKYPEAAMMAQKSMQLSGLDDPFRDDIQALFTELQEIVTAL
jgi:tetratricopeptide (TPR) repeat protein